MTPLYIKGGRLPALFGFCENTLRAYVAQGLLPDCSVKIGGSRLYAVKKIESALDRRLPDNPEMDKIDAMFEGFGNGTQANA